MVGEAHSYDNYRKMAEEDIAPYLIPEIGHEQNHDRSHSHEEGSEGFSALVITRPTEFTHHIHVDYDPERGFIGLPDAWKEILEKGLNKGDITIDEVMNHKEDAARIAGVCIGGLKICHMHLLTFHRCCHYYYDYQYPFESIFQHIELCHHHIIDSNIFPFNNSQ